MRSLILAGLTMVTAIAATPAQAQRLGAPGAPYPYPGRSDAMPARPYPGQSYPAQRRVGPGPSYPGQQQLGPRRAGGGQRWGGSIGGRWSGGVNAPGGWNAYRRPSRGYSLPRYWVGTNFYIGDYGSYGLQAPPQGYRWHRYYDDAVLVDGRGRVWDSVSGLDWDRGDYGDDDGYGYAEGGYASSGYGYADGGQGAPGVGYAPPPVIVTQGAYSSTYSSGAGYASQGGYAAGGYWYPPATTTVVTIQGAPSVTTTTTTTEYVEETTRYVAPRRVYRAKRRYRAPVRRRCVCQRVEAPIQGS